jgi:hypothetical protein
MASKFRIGDRVKIVGNSALGIAAWTHGGRTGRVVASKHTRSSRKLGGEQRWVGVDFGPSFLGGHSLNGKLSRPSGYWFYERELTLVKERKAKVEPVIAPAPKTIRVGSTVVTTSDSALGVADGPIRPGLTGKVVLIDTDGDLGVDFGSGFRGHDLDGRSTKGRKTGYYLRKSEVRLAA